MKKQYKFTILFILITMLLSGCTPANWNSVFRSNTAPEGKFFIDAKQRVVYSKKQPSTGTTLFKLCAEPSPDVFSAFVTSIEAEKNNDQRKITLDLSETATQLDRIATTELIREWLYRTCEATFNGLAEDYTAVQANFLMTSASLLAIDRLGAALTCAPTAKADAKAGNNEDKNKTATTTASASAATNAAMNATASATANAGCSPVTSGDKTAIAQAIEGIIDKASKYNTVAFEKALFTQVIKKIPSDQLLGALGTLNIKGSFINDTNNTERLILINALLDEVNKCTKEIEKLTQEKNNLTEKIKELTGKIEKLTQEKNKHAEEIEKLREEINKLTKKIENLREEKKELTDKINKLIKKNE